MQFLKKYSKHLFKASVLLFFFLTALTPGGVFAQDTTSCLCYCGTEEEGAKRVSEGTDAHACLQSCVGMAKAYLGCFPPEGELPEDDEKCWTKAECDQYGTDSLGNVTGGTWGGQNENCVKSLSGEEKGYCYAPEKVVRLNVPLLGEEEVKGFPEYLSLAYQFLLPAMSLIAVVMIMIGGLEYVVAGGNAKRVERAKTRITNAIIGLILLLSAYTIAYLLDPRLVRFEGLRVPLIKQAVLLDPNSSCERLMDYGFGIAPSSGTCGSKGVVRDISGVDQEARNSNWKEGDECPFMSCGDTGRVCQLDSDGIGKCVFCAAVTTVTSLESEVVSDLASLAPSEYVCSQMQSLAESQDPNPDHKYFCEFQSGGLNACASVGSSLGEPWLNCGTLRSMSFEATDPCSPYDTLGIMHAGFQLPFVFLANAGLFPSGVDDLELAREVCTSDPCDLARFNGMAACVFSSGTLLNSCIAQ